jgi:hypothetical protein
MSVVAWTFLGISCGTSEKAVVLQVKISPECGETHYLCVYSVSEESLDVLCELY